MWFGYNMWIPSHLYTGCFFWNFEFFGWCVHDCGSMSDVEARRGGGHLIEKNKTENIYLWWERRVVLRWKKRRNWSIDAHRHTVSLALLQAAAQAVYVSPFESPSLYVTLLPSTSFSSLSSPGHGRKRESHVWKGVRGRGLWFDLFRMIANKSGRWVEKKVRIMQIWMMRVRMAVLLKGGLIFEFCAIQSLWDIQRNFSLLKIRGVHDYRKQRYLIMFIG